MNDELFNQASVFSDHQDYAKALPLWETLVTRLNPQKERYQQEYLYTCLINLGECHSELEQYSEAIPIFEKAIDLGETLAEEHLFIPLAELAWLHNETGDSQASILLYQKALETADEDYSYFIWFHLSEIFVDTDFPKAIYYLQQALDLVSTTEDIEQIFIVIEKLITYNQRRALFQEAIRYGKIGVDLLSGTSKIIDIRTQLAVALEMSGRIKEATEQLDKIAAELDQWKEEDEYGVFELNLWHLRGNIKLRENDAQKAEEYYQKAFEFAAQNEPQAVASLYYDIGVTLLELEDYPKAEEYLQNAVKMGQELEYSIVSHSARGQLGALYYSIGNYTKAIEIQEALLIDEKAEEDWSAYSSTLNNLAAAYRQVGQLKKAETLYEETGTFAEKLGPMDKVLYLRNKAALAGVWGADEQSIPLLEEALALATANNLLGEIAVLQREFGVSYYALGHYEKALDYLNPLLENKDFMLLPSNQLSVYNLLGIIHNEKGDAVLAEHYLQKAIQTVEDFDIYVSLPTVYNNLGVFYFDHKKYKEATPLLLKSLEIDKELGQLSQLSTDYHNIGLLYHDQGFYEKALPHFQEAIRIKENLRSQGGDQQRLAYLDQEYNSYELLVDTYIQLGKEATALSTLEQYKNRELLKKMKAKIAPEAINFEKIQALLPTDTCLIVLNNSRTNALAAFGITKKNHTTITIPLEKFFSGNYPGSERSKQNAPSANWYLNQQQLIQEQLSDTTFQKIRHRTAYSEKLEALIHYYRQRINRDPRLWSSKKINSDREIGAFFYKLLFAPFEKMMEGVRQIMIVPDDLLGLLPLDTLLDGQGHYLAEQYSLQYLPSVKVLCHLLEKAPSSNKQKVLAIGVENYQSHPEKFIPEKPDEYERLGLNQWSNLSFAELEVKCLAEVIQGEVDVLTGKQISPSILKDSALAGELKKYNILHFATHAITLPNFSDLSALVLSPEGKDSSPYFSLSQIEQLNLDNDLSFLSACETALGKLYSGDATISLTNAFLIAGSRTVISTLWAIHDKHSMLFVEAFYKNLQNHSITEALAITKRMCIDGKLGTALQKSIYWGAFVLWGASKVDTI